MPLDHGSAEGRKISVFLVVLADIDVREMACWFGAAVHSEVFRRRNHAVIMRIIALHSSHESYRHTRAQKWILAVRFLSPPPTWIAKDIDVRRPEIEAFKNVRVAGAFVLRMFDSTFYADHRCHFMNVRHIEGRRESDGLGKFRSAVNRDAM